MRSRQAELLVQEHRPNTSVTSSRVARRFARQPRLTAGLLVVAFAAIVLGHAADGLHAQPAVRDPLTWLGRIERGGAIEEFMALGIAARGNYLFVARSYELDVFDVTVPTRPAKVASLDHPTVPTLASEFARENWMRLDGSLLFLAGSPPVIIDVADPRAPRLVSVLANDVSASAVAVAGVAGLRGPAFGASDLRYRGSVGTCPDGRGDRWRRVSDLDGGRWHRCPPLAHVWRCVSGCIGSFGYPTEGAVSPGDGP